MWGGTGLRTSVTSATKKTDLEVQIRASRASQEPDSLSSEETSRATSRKKSIVFNLICSCHGDM